jgi:hypothetical protein
MLTLSNKQTLHSKQHNIKDLQTHMCSVTTKAAACKLLEMMVQTSHLAAT